MDKVAVLMAVFNGVKFLSQQVESIMNQHDVELTLFISDDLSDDGSFELVNSFQFENIVVLERTIKHGSAGQNFFRLILDVDFSDYSYVAFVDQDDIWLNDKLINHINISKKYGASGVSSNVLAFWEDGKTKLINKSQPQKKYDYIFESAGPGSTFLMTKILIENVKQLIKDNRLLFEKFVLHDWAVYLICRHYGQVWIIDREPSVYYRQHNNNVLSANTGLNAKLNRLKRVGEYWYRDQILRNIELCNSISYNKELEIIKKLILRKCIKSRLTLITRAFQFRRRSLDVLSISLFILIGFI